jgi:hypothetical protein
MTRNAGIEMIRGDEQKSGRNMKKRHKQLECVKKKQNISMAVTNALQTTSN